jgi:hypothetical protein
MPGEGKGNSFELHGSFDSVSGLASESTYFAQDDRVKEKKWLWTMHVFITSTGEDARAPTSVEGC